MKTKLSILAVVGLLMANALAGAPVVENLLVSIGIVVVAVGWWIFPTNPQFPPRSWAESQPPPPSKKSTQNLPESEPQFRIYDGPENVFRCHVVVCREEHGFFAYAAQLPGPTGHGKTVSDALDSISEALTGVLSEYVAGGEKIPWSDAVVDGHVVREEWILVEIPTVPSQRPKRPSRPVSLCECDGGSDCPLGRSGMDRRCSAEALRVQALMLQAELDHENEPPHYFPIRKGEVHETLKCDAGDVFVDYDAFGQIVGIELLGTAQTPAFRTLQYKRDAE